MDAKIKKRIGEFVLLGLYLVFDVVEWWPQHHFMAIVSFIVGAIALLFLDAEFSNKTITITSSVIILLGLGTYFIAPPAEKVDVEVSASLQPGNTPTPPNGCSSYPNTLKILIGNNAVAHTGAGKFTALQIGQCRILSMEKHEYGIGVNVDLYDRDGKLITRIVNNQAYVMTGENVSIKRNGDLSALVIVDSKGIELLNIRYLNPDAVQVRGIFGCPGHHPVTVKDNEPIPGFMASYSCAIDNEIGMAMP